MLGIDLEEKTTRSKNRAIVISFDSSGIIKIYSEKPNVTNYIKRKSFTFVVNGNDRNIPFDENGVFERKINTRRYRFHTIRIKNPEQYGLNDDHRLAFFY